MARKIRGFERVLDAPALFAIAYGEIGASIYVALGIVAGAALGLTPIVLAATGLVFLLVALSYAEGTAALPETGGAATFTRRAFNDLVGFVTGWALFLDYLIVISLSALFLPHYVGAGLGIHTLRDSPWDTIVAIAAVAAIGGLRLVRRSRLYLPALVVALLDLAVQSLIVLLGFALVFSPDVLTNGFSLAPGQDWLDDVVYAIPLGFVAYTGLETVANLAEEAREPGRTLPRSLFGAIGLVVILTVLVAVVGMTAFPAQGGSTELGERWLEAPLVGIVTAFDGHLPAAVVGALRGAVGLSAALILVMAVTTSISGCARLAHSMGSHGMLPRELGRLERRTLVSREAIAAITVVAMLVLGVSSVVPDEARFLAGTYSFGVLLAFTLAQLAVIRLRRREPDLDRPFRARPNVRVRGVDIPLPALVGAPLTAAVFVIALVTHESARYAGPAWIAIGLVIYVVTRTRAKLGVLADVDPRIALPTGIAYQRILVPMKLGVIGEEMVATAVALAKERGARIEAITVVQIPRERALDEPLPEDLARAAAASIAEARALGEDNEVEVQADAVPARSIGHAIVAEAARRQADLIVLGSSPRWRRQSRFFSPTVDYVLKNAPCEVLVVAFPDGVFEVA
ncbi:universal stress protein [Gaiella sp.]|uniref:universal stress protein n=1 Tax=Gaiella sp. TaxID=2663207 RepID=UPI002E30FDB8|nr:universal stress protein [Gaiella sp.]HEX5582375.1 universal stress protein [Gaiella sp.]